MPTPQLPAWHRLMKRSSRQHQVFTTQQAVAEGVAATTLRDRASRLAIADLGRDLWACAGSPNTYHRKLWVAKLGLGPEVVFTGRTSLWLRGIISSTPSHVDILAGPSLHLRGRPKLHCFRGKLLDDDSLTNMEGFTCTSVYRAFTDVASVVPVETLLRWLQAMDRLRRGNLNGLDAYSVTRGRFVGVVNLRAAVVALREGLSHSGTERVARAALSAAGARPYPRPYPVRAGARLLAEIDLAYPKALYGVEVDGPHHLLREVAAADRARDRALGRLGWTIDRFPVEMVLEHRDQFLAEVLLGLNGAIERNAALTNR